MGERSEKRFPPKFIDIEPGEMPFGDLPPPLTSEQKKIMERDIEADKAIRKRRPQTPPDPQAPKG